jgi:anti-sigma factor RsiW
MLSLDSALPDQERASFEEHIASCADCAKEYLEFTRLTRELNQVPTPPPGFWDDVWREVRLCVRKGSDRRQPLSRPVVVAATSACILIMALISMRSQPPASTSAYTAYVPSQHALMLMHHPYTEPGLVLLAMSEGTVARYSAKNHGTN